jgi:transmembrane sensor
MGIDYSMFDIEDFAVDEYFIEWVKAPNESSNAFWTAWLSKHPHQKEIIKKARHIVLSMEISENVFDQNTFIEGWATISKHIHHDQHGGHKHEGKVVSRVFRWPYIAAAGVAAVVMLTAGLFYYVNRSVVVVTAFGESRSLFLPDNSKVTLNGNSSLRYHPFYFSSNSREVWLGGEAFFAVEHLSNQSDFSVHTDELAVKVLGTKFNVNSRRGKTQVVLAEGKVQLTTSKEMVVMKPGDLADVSSQTKAIRVRTVDVNDYTAWRSNRIVFKGSSLEDIGLWLEDSFGYTVIFEADELRQREFTGAAAADDIEGLLTTLSEVFELSIEKNEKTITIKRK